MSIGAVTGNPWTIPFPSFGSSSPTGSTTGTDALPDFSVAESQGTATNEAGSATSAGTSTTSGSTLGLPTLLADFQNWLLQMQMQSGTNGSATGASATSGTSASGSEASGTCANGTGTSGTADGTDWQTASAGSANTQHGSQRDQAMSLLRNIDTELTSINSELQGTETTSQTG